MSHMKSNYFQFLMLGVAAGLSLGAFAATVYYVPSAAPYQWTDACWFTDSAGTTVRDVPTSSDLAYFGATALKNNTISIPSGTTAVADGIQLRQVGSTLAIENGGQLVTYSTTTFGKANNTTLRVKEGGEYVSRSVCIVSDSTRSGVKLLIDAGGCASFSNLVYVANNTTSGSGTIENHGDVYFQSSPIFGRWNNGTWTAGAKHSAKGFLDNYGTLRTRASTSQCLNIGGLGSTGYLTNRVGGVVKADMAVVVGSFTNGTGYAVNDGTFLCSKFVTLGGSEKTSAHDDIPEGNGSSGTFRNNAEMVVMNGLYLGGHKFGTGVFDNYGHLIVSNDLQIGYRQATGTFTARAGSTTSLSGGIVIGYYGDATLAAEGDAVIDVNNSGLRIANAKSNSSGRIRLSGTSCLKNVGTVQMAYTGSSQADIELSDDAKIDGTGSFFVGRGSTGSTSVSNFHHACVSLSDRSMITNLNGNICLATNNYGRAELIVADDAVIDFDNVETVRSIEIAKAHSGTRASLTLRGGTICLPSTNSIIRVGFGSYTADKCNGFVRGWGRIIRHDWETMNAYTHAINLVMPCGAIVADGEGVAHDLDLSMIRKINDGSDPGANLSGTNGWYAINKGRLYYPCRNGGYTNLGTYYSSLSNNFVNGVNFAFVNRPTDAQLHGLLYATDREDIPAGLPVDDLEHGVKRLGVWRAGLRSSHYAEKAFAEGSSAKSFTSATAKIRYDNHQLNALRDEDGNLPDGQMVKLFQYRNGAWTQVATLTAAAGEKAGHFISGTLLPTNDDWNIGFFAVVAVRNQGTSILIR